MNFHPRELTRQLRVEPTDQNSTSNRNKLHILSYRNEQTIQSVPKKTECEDTREKETRVCSLPPLMQLCFSWFL
jgi:hypothetical protein